jgi:hypothetical protein
MNAAFARSPRSEESEGPQPANVSFVLTAASGPAAAPFHLDWRPRRDLPRVGSRSRAYPTTCEPPDGKREPQRSRHRLDASPDRASHLCVVICAGQLAFVPITPPLFLRLSYARSVATRRRDGRMALSGRWRRNARLLGPGLRSAVHDLPPSTSLKNCLACLRSGVLSSCANASQIGPNACLASSGRPDSSSRRLRLMVI